MKITVSIVLLILNFSGLFSQCKSNPLIIMKNIKGELINPKGQLNTLDLNFTLSSGSSCSWSPTIGISCIDCIAPEFKLLKDTVITYTRTIKDLNKKCIQIDTYQIYYLTVDLISTDISDSFDSSAESNFIVPIEEGMIAESIISVNGSGSVDSLFYDPDASAFYPGYFEFIKQNLIYPLSAKEEGLEGKCYLTLVVNAKGECSNIRVLRGVTGCPECDKEAIRVLKKTNTWIPATSEGKNVTSQTNVIVKFTLEK